MGSRARHKLHVNLRSILAVSNKEGEENEVVDEQEWNHSTIGLGLAAFHRAFITNRVLAG
jgi:hypothetical protein